MQCQFCRSHPPNEAQVANRCNPSELLCLECADRFAVDDIPIPMDWICVICWPAKDSAWSYEPMTLQDARAQAKHLRSVLRGYPLPIKVKVIPFNRQEWEAKKPW